MASWEDDEDFTPENTWHQTTWNQLQRQHAERQIGKPRIAASGPRQFNISSASDEEAGGTTRLPPRRQYYHSHINSDYSDSHRGCNPVDDDSPASENRRFGATHTVDYVRLNRRQLKGHNNRKFIYPPKTYTEMFNKKKLPSVGYRSFSHTSGKLFIILCFSSYIIIVNQGKFSKRFISINYTD